MEVYMVRKTLGQIGPLCGLGQERIEKTLYMCGASIQSTWSWQVCKLSGVQISAATILNWQVNRKFNKPDELQNIRIFMRLKTIPPIQQNIQQKIKN